MPILKVLILALTFSNVLAFAKDYQLDDLQKTTLDLLRKLPLS